MPDISCIIVTYGNEETIGECLKSVISDLNKFSGEILVIDNASSDNTLSIVNLIQRNRNCEIRTIVNVYNLGFTRAANQGLVASRGKYILLLNPDTIVHSGFFKTMVSILEKNNTIGIVAPQHVSPSGSITPSCREFPNHLSLLFFITGFGAVFPDSRVFNGWKMGYFDNTRSRAVDQPMGACLMTRRKDFERVGYLDEQFWMFFSDVDWCRRFLCEGKQSYFLADARITHFTGHSVLRRPVRMIISSHRAFNQYFWKYYRGWVWFIPNIMTAAVLLFTALVRILIRPFRTK